MKGYFKALALGYTVPVNEIYAAAGIRFDFSDAYIAELMQFVQTELDNIPD
jgi:oligoendopeptidase F